MTDETERPDVGRIHDTRYATKGRRGFLRALTGVGFAASTAAHLTVEDVQAAGDGEVPVVVGFRHDPEFTSVEPQTRTVPADWYDDYLHATRVFEANRRRLVERSGVKAVSFVPGDYGGDNARVTVDVNSAEEPDAAGSVPERVDGVPVEVREVRGHELGYCSDLNYNTGHFPDDTPGSIQVCSGDSTATLTCRVYDPNDYQEYFLVSNHLYGGQGDDHAGESLYQPDASYPALGVVEQGHCYVDAMRIDPRNGHDPVSRIEDIYPSENLTGWFTRDGLSDMKADGEYIQKYGCRTGTTMGPIESTDGWTSYYGCTPKVGQLQWGDNDDMDDGDSGSLAVNAPPDGSGGYESDEVWACGMCNARTADWASDGANYVWGTAAWKLHNKFGWYF